MVVDGSALEQAVLDQLRQAVAEDVRGHAEAALDVGEAAAAEEDVAHHEQRPALADDRERAAIEQFCSLKGRYGMAPS